MKQTANIENFVCFMPQMLHINISPQIFKTLWMDYIPLLILLHVQYCFFCTIRIFVYSAWQFNCWIEIRAHYWTNVDITASKSGCEISGIRRVKCEVFTLLVRHPGLACICLPTFRVSRNVGKQTLYDNPEERRPQTQLSLATYKQSSVREKELMVHGSVWS